MEADNVINFSAERCDAPHYLSNAAFEAQVEAVIAAKQRAESNINSSPEFAKLAAALAKAQGEIKNPAKDSENPHFKSSYANLASGLVAVKAALSKHEIAVIQVERLRTPLRVLYTRLIHSSGQWIETEFPIGPAAAAPQPHGSALTYARRYSLFTLVGIAGEDDDDDGNAAQAGHQAQAPIMRGKQTITSGKREVAASSASLTDEESKTLLGKMLAKLGATETREALVKWATEAGADKNRLGADDQAMLSAAFKKRQADIQAPKAEPVDADGPAPGISDAHESATA
jgi:ERF superfamily